MHYSNTSGMSYAVELRRKMCRNSIFLTIHTFVFVVFLYCLQQKYPEFLISKRRFLESEDMPVC